MLGRFITPEQNPSGKVTTKATTREEEELVKDVEDMLQIAVKRKPSKTGKSKATLLVVDGDGDEEVLRG